MATATPKVFTIGSSTNAFLETQSGFYATEAEAIAAAQAAAKINPTGTVYVNQRLRAYRATVEIGEVGINEDAPAQAPADAQLESPQA